MILQRTYTSTYFKLKAAIGKQRVKLADKLQDRISRHIDNKGILDNKIESTPQIVNKELYKKLKDIADINGIKLNRTSGVSSLVYDDDKSLNDYSIYLNPKDGVETFAHELGHVSDIKERNNKMQQLINTTEVKQDLSYSTAKGLRDKIRSDVKLDDPKFSRKLVTKQAIKELKDSGKLDTGKGLGETFRRMREGRKVIVGQESAASNNALKLLKNIGANKKELRLGRKNLNLAKKTYKEDAKIHVLNPIQNLIQIPSRRRK